MCHRCDTVDRILHPERYIDDLPWIPSAEDLAFEPRPGDRMQPQAAKPEPDVIERWESEGGYSGLRA